MLDTLHTFLVLKSYRGNLPSLIFDMLSIFANVLLFPHAFTFFYFFYLYSFIFFLIFTDILYRVPIFCLFLQLAMRPKINKLLCALRFRPILVICYGTLLKIFIALWCQHFTNKVHQSNLIS